MPNYISQLNEIKMKMELGIISYEEAKVLAQPIIDEMNNKAEKIAKKYNRKFTKFNFIQLMR